MELGLTSLWQHQTDFKSLQVFVLTVFNNVHLELALFFALKDCHNYAVWSTPNPQLKTVDTKPIMVMEEF